ncbi:siderophore synthetase component/RimJ/RimL family protein N-acetyltransferase [Chryseobacterium defluvii]|uniref:Siderophore synthetase component/RimJ/RimL family protein N-acetyltransferase n=1 Tax=Chryseobacterium defluvii TaxID=160396 RepID=A0A840KBX4_9FLAO|nr:GNAT family N-acetyltransferase [Chryseobacterium defluvii]MBB4805507.1 siderophore synthetase component/RimJ/RimL family protein N-acetyltransferase [Chryseobacterium defluvii]
MNTLKLTNIPEYAEKINYTAFINCYMKEFTNWSRYLGIPKYDEAIAKHLQKTPTNLHIRIDFSSIGCDVYVPVNYFSESGRHLFDFPVLRRVLETDEVSEVDIYGFMSLTAEYARGIYPDIDASTILKRLNNSIENLTTYLNHLAENNKQVNAFEMSFIEAEQSLILGHILHPVPKSKQGFNPEDLLKYSPETSGKFQLFYFLINPENIIEKNADGRPITKELGEKIYPLLDKEHKQLWDEFPDYHIVPMHPWEAEYLLSQENIQIMLEQGIIFALGHYGEYFTPTSSVRTVYSETNKWMYKFSLHVKITNSERINLYPELHRGHDISRLLKTDWGKSLQKDYPEIDFMVDPAFIAVTFNGKVINGFNISIRRNPFQGEDKNVTLLAALCQDGIFGQPSRLQNIIEQAAQDLDLPVEQVALDWFKQYLHVCVRPIVGILNTYGLACEFHQQNVMIELDKKGFPAKIYFRDNQGFFFREGRKEMVSKALPGIADESQSIIDEESLAPKYTYYLVTNNILGVVNALGCNRLAEERKLINLVYKAFRELENEDETGLVNYIINTRSWYTKGNLITSLQNINEADESLEYPAVFLDTPNPLNKYFFTNKLIKPETKETVYSRYFPEENVNISIRPFDIDKDFEMVHEWFNMEHAKPFWKMDGPKRDLELWFRTILPSDEQHSFIGYVNDVPQFSFEPYWPMRDIVGAYYDALPTDYGTHFFVAETQKDKKFSFQSFQVALDYIFSLPEVGKCIGEASVDAVPTDRIITRLGYTREGVIEMPHKTAYLTFCTRENYWEACPESRLEAKNA